MKNRDSIGVLRNNRMILRGALLNNVFIGVVIIAILIVSSIASPNFFTASNFTNVLQQVSIKGLLCLGAAVVLISSNVDLSVGMLTTFVACFSAWLYETYDMSFYWISAIAMLLALGCGLGNGFICSRFKAESFIVTLGTASVFQGASLICTNAASISLKNNFEFLGQYRFPMSNIPLAVVIFISLCVVFALMMKFTRYGRKIYALGGNQEAAMLAGVDVKNYKLSVFTINGLMCGIAGLVMLSRLGSANATLSSGYELDAIAGAVVGGVSLSGGKGNIFGAVLGILLLGIITNAMNINRIPTFYQYIVIGVIIVIAVVVSSYEKGK